MNLNQISGSLSVKQEKQKCPPFLPCAFVMRIKSNTIMYQSKSTIWTLNTGYRQCCCNCVVFQAIHKSQFSIPHTWHRSHTWLALATISAEVTQAKAIRNRVHSSTCSLFLATDTVESMFQNEAFLSLHPWVIAMAQSNSLILTHDSTSLQLKKRSTRTTNVYNRISNEDILVGEGWDSQPMRRNCLSHHHSYILLFVLP